VSNEDIKCCKIPGSFDKKQGVNYTTVNLSRSGQLDNVEPIYRQFKYNSAVKIYQRIEYERSIGDRSTFFYEIVQQVNHYDGFGLINIEPLFKAKESELNLKLNSPKTTII